MMRVVHDEPKMYGRIALQFGISGDRTDLKGQYSQFMFQPNHLRIEYRVTRTGVWLEDSWTISGYRRLKDGSVSATSRHKRDSRFGQTQSNTPDWVMELAEKYRPGRTATTANAANDTTLFLIDP